MAEGKYLVGVDIGSSAIKVIQLKEIRKKPVVVRAGYAELPPQAIVDGHVMNASAVVDAIKRVFADNRISQKEVCIGLAGQSVIVRKLTVPMMSPAELAEQIPWEAEQHIPFDIKVMSIDYEVIRRRPETGQMDVLLVAAKKDEVNEILQLLKDAKLKPVVVDINAFTVQNAYEHQRGSLEGSTVALVNVGANVTSLNVVADGVSAFSRELTTAGASVTEQIERSANVPNEQAEAYKTGGDGVEIVPQDVFQVIANACEALAGDIQRSLDFYLATSSDATINQVVLCGGSAYLAPLAKAIERRARIPVEVFDPLAGFEVDAKTVQEEPLRARSAQFTVALGLALRTEKEKRG